VLAYPVWLVRAALWWLREALRRTRRPPARVSFLLESAPSEPPPLRQPFWRRFVGGGPPPGLPALAEHLRAAAADPRVKAVLLHLRPMDLSQAQVDALRRLLQAVRAADVRVTCWAPGYTLSTYQVACAADEILLQPGGGVAPLGIAREYLFLADALGRAGLGADFVAISPYKTAGDMLTRAGFSRESREMAEWLADGVFAEVQAAVAAGRRLEEADARSLIDRSPFTDEEAVAAGAVDAVVSEEDLPGRLGGPVRPWRAARRSLPARRPVRPGQVVGLLRVEGTIVDGRSRRAPFQPPLAPPLLFQDQCGDLTVVEQARALASDRRVGAVVLWVSSPGGSATASEAMAAALADLARRKPLVASMGPVAASGGYYVTTAARRVFAHPGTMTGSIGVLAGKLVTGGLFDRLLLHREHVQRGEHAAMWSTEQPFTDAERARVQEMIERSYRLFLARVAAGRGRPAEAIEPVAGGRVWTGSQALERGLVDELGGLEQAAAAARHLARLPADAPLRDARGGRRELLPSPPVPAVPPGALAALEHALRAVAALNAAPTWYLCPLVIPPEGGS
jgi:protease-4